MTRILTDERSAGPARHAVKLLRELFGRGGDGAEMAARAVTGVMNADEVRLSCEVLSNDLLEALDTSE